MTNQTKKFSRVQYVRKETLLDQTPGDTVTAFKVFATAEQ